MDSLKLQDVAVMVDRTVPTGCLSSSIFRSRWLDRKCRPWFCAAPAGWLRWSQTAEDKVIFSEFLLLWLRHLSWKLGLWMIWESFPKESTLSIFSSVCAAPGLGCSGTPSPEIRASGTVLILGRNWARAGTPRSRPCSRCRWFPKLRRTLCLSEV